MDVVGPVCESTDVLGKNRELAIREGDYLALLEGKLFDTDTSIGAVLEKLAADNGIPCKVQGLRATAAQK